MIPVDIDKEMYERARAKADEMGAIKNSITSGAQNIYGFLGEEIFMKRYKQVEYVGNYDYDFESPVGTVDVKSIMCRSKPQLGYDVGATENIKNKTSEWLVFCRVLENYKKGWIVGKKKRLNYIRDAELVEGGTFYKGRYRHATGYWDIIANLVEMGK